MDFMEINNLQKFLKIKNTPKFTAATNAETTQTTKKKAPTKKFKTNERKRVYTKDYSKKRTSKKNLATTI